jgi:RNase H-fold protein (predicted Holliday junction resolvase)
MVDTDSPKILGLDVSTKTIGWALFDIKTKNLLELTHISPKTKEEYDNKMQNLFSKSIIFGEKIKEYAGLGIEKVVVEEPLLNSNNVYTVASLIRYNTLICREIYEKLGIIPELISTYNSRKFAFPYLVKPNDKGKFVLFGEYPKGADKKMIIWEQVAKREPQIQWQYTKNNTLKKENFDQTDAYCAVLGYMKMNNIW